MTIRAPVWLGLSLLLPPRAGIARTPVDPPLTDARLKQLAEQFDGGDRQQARQAEAQLRRLGLRRVLPRMERLEERAAVNEEPYYDLAYTLAYFHFNYRRNVRRLTALDDFWDRGDSRWRRYLDMRDEIPVRVAALYEHNHDPTLLRTLFGWGLDGFAAEVLDDLRVELITKYPLPVFRVIQHSPGREEGALRSLGGGVGADEKEYRKAVARIRRAEGRAGPALRPFMRRFLRRVAARWTISQDGKELRRADLAGMNLSGMDLSGRDLRGADLRGARLEYTDLQGAKLRGARLRGARYDRHTVWPASFDPRRHGAMLVR